MLSHFSSRARPRSLKAFHIFATTFDLNTCRLPTTSRGSQCGTSASASASVSSAASELDPVLERGLEAWIPVRTTGDTQYHLYAIAVQRCRSLGRLRKAIHEHLGGSARYVLAGSADIGEALHGRTAILLFARTADVESGAFRIIASNEHPIILRRSLSGGVKGVLGVAFSYYDTTVAVMNTHLPATSLYPESASRSAQEQREKHLEAVLQKLRLGACHPTYDAQLQYHHAGSSGESRPGAATTAATPDKLQNLYRIYWQPGFEAPETVQRLAPSRPPALGGRSLSDVAAAVNRECKEPGRATATEDSILLDVLTLGPPRHMQHALIKFVGKHGKELGQGFLCVGELISGSGGESAFSHCATRREVGHWGPGSPPSAISTGGASSTGVVATRHSVDLVAGGRFKGTVEFDLAVKAKRRTKREAEALQRGMEVKTAE